MEVLTQIFGNCSQVKIIDFLVAHPWSEFSKTELADGAKIARPTVYKLLDSLLKENLVIEDKKVGNIQLYKINRESPIIKHISRLQSLLADIELERQKESFDEEIIELSDEELDKLLAFEEQKALKQDYKAEKSDG